jgi:hypothetical protein
VHRLDRDTSGCLLVARKRAALVSAHALLREGELEKHYTALVVGRWRLGRKTIDAPVLTHARQGGERVVRVHRGGKIAVVHLRSGDAFSRSATRMDIAIKTGRTHQIRVHAAFAGHPVAGDEKYGDRESNAPLRASAFAACSCMPLRCRSAGLTTGRHFAWRRHCPWISKRCSRSSGWRRGRLRRARTGRGPRLAAPGEPDDRKPDECGRIARVQGCEERGSETFAAKTARAIERPVEFDVAGNLLRSQCAEMDGREVHMLGHGVRFGAAEDGRRVEFDLPAAARGELLAAACRVARLVEDAFAACRHLVRADDPAPGCRFDTAAALAWASRKARTRRFARLISFVDTGRLDGEGQAEPLEERHRYREVEARKSGCAMALRA